MKTLVYFILLTETEVGQQHRKQQCQRECVTLPWWHICLLAVTCSSTVLLFLVLNSSAKEKALLHFDGNIFIYRLISFTNFNTQFLYSLTTCMLHYNPRRVSSINMPIFRRTNCIITASGIITLCKRLALRHVIIELWLIQ